MVQRGVVQRGVVQRGMVQRGMGDVELVYLWVAHLDSHTEEVVRSRRVLIALGRRGRTDFLRRCKESRKLGRRAHPRRTQPRHLDPGTCRGAADLKLTLGLLTVWRRELWHTSIRTQRQVSTASNGKRSESRVGGAGCRVQAAYQVPQLLVVHLKARDLKGERPPEATEVLGGGEDLLGRARHHAAGVAVGAFHCVRLAAAGLAVGKDAHLQDAYGGGSGQ